MVCRWAAFIVNVLGAWCAGGLFLAVICVSSGWALMGIIRAGNWAFVGVGVIWAILSIDISCLLLASICSNASLLFSAVNDLTVAQNFRISACNGAVSVTISTVINSFTSWDTNISFHTSINHLFSGAKFVWGLAYQLTMLLFTIFSSMIDFFCFAGWWLGTSVLWRS